MNLLKSIWQRILALDNQPLNDRISELEALLDTEIDNYNFMKEQYESMHKTKNELLEELETYKKVEVPFTIPTDIIDTSKQPYLPSTLIYYYDPKLKKVQTKSVQVTPSKYYRMWTDEMYMFFRNAIKTCNTFDEKVVKLRNTIKSMVDYKSDLSQNGLNSGENWRFPIETFYGKIGDCEDTTSLWVTACHICGLPADRVFNATGEYKLANGMIGHSFGLAKMDSGDWYVIETTSTIPKQKLLGSKEYFIRGFLNGLSNWEMSGKAKKEQF
jgi:transglutaminase-like putative cysteine protease